MVENQQKPSLNDICQLMNGLVQYLLMLGMKQEFVKKMVDTYNEGLADWRVRNVKEAEIIDIAPFLDNRKEDDEQEEE